MTTNRRLWIEYTGSWPNHTWHYNGRAVAFWTLSDGRQVSDTGDGEAYRHILEAESDIVPFVPRGEEDWIEITELVQKADREAEIAAQKDTVAFLDRRAAEVQRISVVKMQRADTLELESQGLRSEVLGDEESAKELLAKLEDERAKLKAMTAPSEPRPKKKAPAKKPPAKPKKKE